MGLRGLVRLGPAGLWPSAFVRLVSGQGSMASFLFPSPFTAFRGDFSMFQQSWYMASPGDIAFLGELPPHNAKPHTV